LGPGGLPLVQPGVVKRDEIICILKNGKIDIFLVDDYDDHSNSKDRMCSLQAPEKVTTFDISEDQGTIATIDEGNFLREWKLQKSKDMYTIMNTD